MPARIAEYLGQRTDVDLPVIRPTALNPDIAPTCPFMGGPCSKITGEKSYPPVCSVRTDQGLFVVCSDRLIPAKSHVITAQHVELLAEVADKLYPGIPDEHVGYRRQLGLRVSGGAIYLDYVLALKPGTAFAGRPYAIVEIQGGGETSNTGTLTKHVKAWSETAGRNNELLRMRFPKVGIIPDNAFKRQLRQVFRKAPLAKKFGGAFALVLGPTLFDYFIFGMDEAHGWYAEWEVALVEVVEVEDNRPGPIPLKTNRTLFMSYDAFVKYMTDAPIPDTTINPFHGSYRSTHNELFVVGDGLF
jgi:hypothetical protein